MASNSSTRSIVIKFSLLYIYMYYIYINVYIIYTTNNINNIYNFVYMYTAYKNTAWVTLKKKFIAK